MLTKGDLSQIQKIVKEEVQAGTNPLKKDMQVVKKDVAQIRKDIKVISSFFDREYLELRRRVEKVEQHLGL